jgi:signal transduction histidine kinase
MSIDVTFLGIFLVTALAYLGLLLYLVRLDQPISVERWMAVFCIWSVAFAGALALNDSRTIFLGAQPGIWLALASLGSLCLLGALTFGYLELPKLWVWAVAIPIASAIVLIGDARDPAPGLTEMTWLAALTQPGWFAPAIAVAWAVVAMSLVALTYFSVTQATMPLLANRRFWWVIALLTIIGSEAVAMWSAGLLAILAQAVRLIGVAIAVYATTTLELIDVRGAVRTVVGNSLFVAAMSGLIVVGILAAFYLLSRLPLAQAQLAIIGVVVLLAIIYQRLRPTLQRVVNRIVFAAGYDTAQIAKGYSQRIANLIDIGELAVAVGITVAQAVQSTKLGFLLLSADGAFTRADVLIGAGTLPTVHHKFDRLSSVLQGLMTSRRPLSQYALDYDPAYRAVSAEDREWLRSLGADIYVPVFDGEVMSAIMAVGKRQTGDAYRQAELDLLASIADQTSVALKNARLVTNLRVLNEEMRSLYENTQVLNKELGSSNERLRQMDKVKTDFINIASHELRTPLTKLRGYTDLLNEMNMSGGADEPTLDMVTTQLNKACVRLEEVIGQMLDVSQLDVEALELMFAPTALHKVLETAAEHFKAALRDRQQTLSIRDAQNMPPVEGDFQRLAQTFRQLIGNAIKFTPDGGRIDVYANFLPANEDRDRPEAVEVVVADSGVGINPEHYDLIFEKFYRVGSVDLHSTGDTKFMGAGPGLGLTIARGVIKSHHGQIWVESDGFDPKTCPGSQFHVILPVRQPNSNKSGEAASSAALVH